MVTFDGAAPRARGRRARPPGAFVFTVLTVAVAACSGAEDRPSSDASSPGASSSGATTTVSAAPSTVGTLDSRLVAEIDVDNPDALVEVGGAVWVKTDDGRVVRIDTSTDTVTGTVQLDTATDPSNYCQGIGTDGTAVWACTASDSTTGIVRIDPATMATGTPVAVDKVFDQLSLPHTARGMWVLTADGTAVTVVDPATQATTSYPLPVRCLQLAASEAVVVATCALDDLVVALNPEDGSELARVSLESPRIAAASGSDVWVDTAQGVTRLNTDLEVRAVYPDQVAGPEGDLAVDAQELWVRGAGGVLWRIDPARDVVAEELTAEPALGAGSLLVTADSVWASSNDEGAVLHLRRAG